MKTSRDSSIILVTGGIRSGKSEYAENIALKLAESGSQKPVYVATAEVYDNEMARRVELHKQRRADLWVTYEETLDPGRLDIKGRIVLLDCLTLWLTNIFLASDMDADRTMERFECYFRHLLDAGAESLLIVTNEIGLGGIPINETQRKFADIQGASNRMVASEADHVVLMVSGLPLHIK